MDNNRSGASIKLQAGAVVYAFVFLASLIFSQALRNAVSGVLLLFVVMMPIVSFTVAMIGRSVIQVYVSSDTQRCEKHTKVGYEIRVINQSLFSYPFVEAVITQPREDGVKCLKKKIFLSLAPFGGYIINKEVSFCYRGLYEIGVSELYISDMLRLFKIRVDVDNYSNVLVYPRFLDIKAKEIHAYTELPSTHAPVKAQEIAEAANIREYQIGDSQKSVHWKLSSKTEELQVKDYSINRDRNIYIFADLAAPEEAPEVKTESNTAKLIRALKDKDRKKIRLRSKGDKAEQSDKIIAAAEGKFGKISRGFKTKARENKHERDVKRGLDEKTLSTVEMIDLFIEETSNVEHKKAKAEKLRRKNEKLAERRMRRDEILDEIEADEGIESDVIDRLYKQINEASSDASVKQTSAEVAFGGAVKKDYADDMAEFCADGIVEIALSAAKRELTAGNRVTLVWYDAREDIGFNSCTISDVSGLEYAFERFSSAPVCPSDKKVCDLTRTIDESLNVSLKFVTANIDPFAITELCKIPAMFGGAGAGCSCEVMLYNPEMRYEDPAARLEYAQGAKERFLSAGIPMTELKYISGDESTTLVSVDY